MDDEKKNFDWAESTMRLSKEEFVAWWDFEERLLPEMYKKMYKAWGEKYEDFKIYTLSEYEVLTTQFIGRRAYAEGLSTKN